MFAHDNSIMLALMLDTLNPTGADGGVSFGATNVLQSDPGDAGVDHPDSPALFKAATR
jgi:hypothetical protein